MNKRTSALLALTLLSASAHATEGKFLRMDWADGTSGSVYRMKPSILKVSLPDGVTCYALSDGSLPDLVKSIGQFQGLGCVRKGE